MTQGAASQPAGPTLAPKKPQSGTEAQPDSTGPAGKSGVPSPDKTGLQMTSDRGVLTINVPAGAKVFINGHETRSQGARRQYVSTGLVPGKVYPYAVTVMVPRTTQAAVGPQWETRVKTAYLRAGEQISMSFDRTVGDVLMAGAQ